MEILLRVKDKMEALLRVKDKKNLNSETLDARLTKRGDVIVVVPDGHNWGKEELTNPDWRIVKVPAVTVEEAAPCLEPEDEFGSPSWTPMSQRRKTMINADHVNLPQAFKAWLVDDTRAQPTFTLSITKQQFADIKALRPTRKV